MGLLVSLDWSIASYAIFIRNLTMLENTPVHLSSSSHFSFVCLIPLCYSTPSLLPFTSHAVSLPRTLGDFKIHRSLVLLRLTLFWRKPRNREVRWRQTLCLNSGSKIAVQGALFLCCISPEGSPLVPTVLQHFCVFLLV